MKRLILLFALGLPGLLRAQTSWPPDTARSSAGAAVLLRGSANLRITQLAARTRLYQQLADTTNGRYGRRLCPGACVVIVGYEGNWLRVRRAKSPRRLSRDTRVYYLPLGATKGARTHVLI